MGRTGLHGEGRLGSGVVGSGFAREILRTRKPPRGEGCAWADGEGQHVLARKM